MNDEAAEFILASVAVVLADVDDDALYRFALKFIPAVIREQLTCQADVEALVLECCPGHPDEAREVAALIDQMVAMERDR